MLNETELLHAPLGLALPHADLSTTRILTLAVPGVRASLRAAASVAVFFATLTIAGLNEHAPLGIQPGQLGQLLAANVPLIAAFAAAYAVTRPWPAFLVVLLMTPLWNAAQVSWQVGPVQVILQTVFIVALALGCVLRSGDERARTATQRASGRRRSSEVVARRAAPTTAGPRLERARAIGFASHHVGWIATIAVIGFATVSTALSPDVETSMAVLVHGIIEPVAMGILLLLIGTNRRRLALVLVALGLSVALGGAINLVQSIPAFGSLDALQAKRLLFSRLTYFNVGLFGEMLAMAAPLLLGAIAARRHLGLGRYAVTILAIALVVSVVSLFLTFSKSAYLATAGGVLVFFLLLAGTWRRRFGILLVATALSAVVVPWPAYVLQVSPTLESVYRDTMVKLVGESRYDSWNPSALSGRGSLVERLLATEAAVQMAVDHPILGIGLDQFKSEYQGAYKNPESNFPADSAHTFWPEVAAELGIPALALVVLIFASALLALWRVYRAPPDEATRVLALTLLASLVAWLMVATAFAGDMYRPWRNMSSDFVMMAVLTGAAFALSRGMLARGNLQPAKVTRAAS